MKHLVGKAPAAAVACLGAVLALATPAQATVNLLVNPGFELGPVGPGIAGWITFGNVFTEAVTPHAGAQDAKTFGNFSGGFNVSGFFQEFPATPGSLWSLDAWSRHNTGDEMVGGGAAGGANWVVMKIVFKDAGDAEIGAAEATILDGTYPKDVWIDNPTLFSAGAPINTVQVEAFILYLQPLFDGGAAFIDDMYFAEVPEPASLMLLGVGGLLALRRRR